MWQLVRAAIYRVPVFCRPQYVGLSDHENSVATQTRMPPRVFCRKSAEVIENKRGGSKKERKERSRVRKRKEVKEIEEVEGANPARFVRDNTRNGTIDAAYLSIVNLSPMV